MFIFHLRVNGSIRFCTAIFNHQSTRTGRRVYLTFISLVVYFIPFIVLVLCYTLIFIELLPHGHQRDEHSSLNNCDITQKRAHTYAKARSKTFRMVRTMPERNHTIDELYFIVYLS
jgi:hypothetical protein